MIYQVRATFFFDEQDEARDFYHDCLIAFPKTRTINPDQENAEPSHAELLSNNHELVPNEPCSIITSMSTSNLPH